MTRDEQFRAASRRRLRRAWGDAFVTNMDIVVRYLQATIPQPSLDALLAKRVGGGVRRGDDAEFCAAAFEMAKHDGFAAI